MVKTRQIQSHSPMQLMTTSIHHKIFKVWPTTRKLQARTKMRAERMVQKETAGLIMVMVMITVIIFMNE